MSLDGVLNSAASGLDSITRQLGLISQNVANAGTPGYVKETLGLSSAEAGGQPYGVRTGVATRAVDARLQADLLASAATEAGEQVTQAALSAIDQVSGTPGSGLDLPGLLGRVRDAFSSLATDPSNATQQQAVVTRADALARGLNGLSDAVTRARQSAQDSLVGDAQSANTALRAVGALSDQIILARSRGETTAGLEDQRDTQERTLAALTGAKFLPQDNGDVLAVAGGTVLPLRGGGPFSVATATLAADTPAAAVPPLLLNGAAVAGLGGQMGAHLALRDGTLPGLQAGLDTYAQSLAAGFQAQGLALFTDPAGAVPPAGTAGFAGTIRVSAAVAATPGMVRDGTAAPGAAGDTTLIDKVLDTVFTTGAAGLAGQATSLVANIAALTANSAARVDTEGAVRAGLEAKLAAGSGVSVDTEMAAMVALQNAYGANAKVVSTIQDLWSQLVDSVK